MEKYEFIEYLASRYGIDGSVAETVVDMFSDCLQEVISAGQSVNIDEIGEFKTTALSSLISGGFNGNNNASLAQVAKQNIVSFTASGLLTREVA
jgi:nucleoid DNA-binding protein